MSSTNRGSKRSEADWYETPPYAVERLLEVPGLSFPGGTWCDPGAGAGAIIRTTNLVRADISKWVAIEIREECKAPLIQTGAEVRIADFLDNPDIMGDVDVILTNPPYRLAMDFIEACLPRARFVCMLLRLNFLGSEKRASFMRGFAPDIYLLPNRPSFCLNKKGRPGTDSPEYGWFLWHGATPRVTGRLQVLGSTPKAARVL